MAMQQCLNDKVVAFPMLAHLIGNPSEIRAEWRFSCLTPTYCDMFIPVQNNGLPGAAWSYIPLSPRAMQWVLNNKTVVLPTLTQLIGNPSEIRAWSAVTLDVGALLWFLFNQWMVCGHAAVFKRQNRGISNSCSFNWQSEWNTCMTGCNIGCRCLALILFQSVDGIWPCSNV